MWSKKLSKLTYAIAKDWADDLPVVDAFREAGVANNSVAVHAARIANNLGGVCGKACGECKEVLVRI